MMYRDLYGEKAFAAAQYEKEREYWLNKLSGELEKTSFPPDFKTTGVGGKKLDTISFKLPRDLFKRLMTVSNRSDSRLHMLLITGLNILLYKYTGHTDIIIGTPIDKQEVEGEFINTVLAIRNQIDEQVTVKEFLMQAQRQANFPQEQLKSLALKK